TAAVVVARIRRYRRTARCFRSRRAPNAPARERTARSSMSGRVLAVAGRFRWPRAALAGFCALVWPEVPAACGAAGSAGAVVGALGSGVAGGWAAEVPAGGVTAVALSRSGV